MSAENTSPDDFFEPDETVAGSPPVAEETEITVGPDEINMRVDMLLVGRLEGISRTRINTAIRRGQVLWNGRVVKPSERLAAGTVLQVGIPPPPAEGPVPENVPLDLVFEDDSIVVVNKPAGMVVHPAKGHWSGTLTAALAWHFQNLSQIGGSHRPGIVHRLDRDTSGVIVVAKTDGAHAALTHQFQNRTVEKEYLAIVTPPPNRDRDQIDLPIGIHPWQREKMAVRDDHPSSREASTLFEVRRRLGKFALVAAFPKTGRTHQIRVHLAAIGSPVLADKHYSGRGWILRSELGGRVGESDRVLERQALHARRIGIRHPQTGEWMEFTAPLPPDIQGVVDLLEQNAGGNR